MGDGPSRIRYSTSDLTSLRAGIDGDGKYSSRTSSSYRYAACHPLLPGMLWDGTLSVLSFPPFIHHYPPLSPDPAEKQF